MLTLCGVAVLTVGGWLGGSLVFVYATRVLGREPEPASPAEPASAGIHEDVN